MIIDFHTHIFPDVIAQRAFDALTKNANGEYFPRYDLTAKGLLYSMQKYGIDKSVVAPVATKPTQSMKNLTWGTEARSDKLYFLAGLYPDAESWVNNVDEALQMGYKGIKLHPEYQNINVWDESTYPLYEYAFNKDMFILFHAGYDPIGAEPFRSNPQAFRKLIEEFKGANIVCAHFGGQSQWEDVYDYLAGTDVYLDTSMGFAYYGVDTFMKIFDKHGADRILFATDSPWSDAGEELNTLLNLNISKEDKEKILYKNALKLL